MFIDFPYRDIGFSDEEWEAIPCGVRRVIRDYYLNRKNADQTMLYCYYDTGYQVRKVEREYKLEERPAIIVRADMLSLV